VRGEGDLTDPEPVPGARAVLEDPHQGRTELDGLTAVGPTTETPPATGLKGVCGSVLGMALSCLKKGPMIFLNG
jgi:hypothetical protein